MYNLETLYQEYEKVFFKDDSLRKKDEIERTTYRIAIGELLISLLPTEPLTLSREYFILGDVASHLSVEYGTRGIFYQSQRYQPHNQENNKKAIDDYTRAIELLKIARSNPNRSLHQCRCECYLEQNLPDRALDDAKIMIQIEADTNGYILLSKCFQALGDYDSAFENAEQAIELAKYPFTQFNALEQRRSLYQETGDFIRVQLDQERMDALSQMRASN